VVALVQNGSQPERDDDVSRLATPPALQIRSLLNTIAIASTADPNAETKKALKIPQNSTAQKQRFWGKPPWKKQISSHQLVHNFLQKEVVLL
jgi:hypothetical protein